MSIIALPVALKYSLERGAGFGQRRYDLMGQSEESGTQRARLYAPPRWTLKLAQPDWLSLQDSGIWKSLIAQLRGRVNVLSAWDIGNPIPLGTFRGTPTLKTTTAKGATSMAISGGGGQAGKTFLPGDMIAIGSGLGTSQLVMITATATADGAGDVTVTFEPSMRTGFTAGAAITYDKPLAYFRLQGISSEWGYVATGVTGVTGLSMDLLETWS